MLENLKMVSIAADPGIRTKEFINHLGVGKQHFSKRGLVIDLANPFRESLAVSLELHPDQNNIDHANFALNAMIKNLRDKLSLWIGFNRLEIPADLSEEEANKYDQLWQYLEAIKTNESLTQQTITDHTYSDHSGLVDWLERYLPEKINDTVWIKEIERQLTKDSERDDLNRCIIAIEADKPVELQHARDFGARIIKIVNSLEPEPTEFAFDALVKMPKEPKNIPPLAKEVRAQLFGKPKPKLIEIVEE